MNPTQKRKRIIAETPEEEERLQKRRKADLLRKQLAKQKETPEETNQRQQKDRKRKRLETQRKREEKQKRDRERIQAKRRGQTEAEKADRRDINRIQVARSRLLADVDEEVHFEAAFPENTPPLTKQAANLFLQTIFLPWKKCDCCGAFRRKDKLRKPKSEDARGHHHLGSEDIASYRLCSKCHAFKATAERPWCPFSHKNAFGPLTIPMELQDLNVAEREIIRLVHPFQTLLVRPKGQQGSRGQVIHLPSSPVEKLRQLLPADPHDVLLVAQEKPNGKVGTFSKLRVEKVLAALRYLKANSRGYRNVDIREEGEIQELFDAWEESQTKVVETPANENDGESGAPEEELPPTESALINMTGTELDKRTLGANFNSPVDRRGEYVEADAYPHLFPNGFGDFSDSGRTIHVSEREYVQHRLLANPEFQRDESWSFRALNNLNQQDMARALQFIQKSEASRRQFNNLTSANLVDAMAVEDSDFNHEDILGHHYFMVGSAIRGTSMYFRRARRHLFSMFATLGAPDLFLTLSANDLQWLDLFHAIDSQRFKSDEDVAKLTPAERVGLLNHHPAICAEHFSNRVQALINFLTSPAKPLGFSLKHFFGRLEIQGRGSPHLHSVLWLDGCPKPTDGRGYLDWIDGIISSQLPDEGVDPELHTLVQRFQVHHHTDSCAVKNPRDQPPPAEESNIEASKDSANEQPPLQPPSSSQSAVTRRRFAILGERAKCRFGFPHPLSKETRFRTDSESRVTVRGDRQLILKRVQPREQWVNNYCGDLLRIWRANMDLQPVTDPYAAAVYMLSYVTKDEKSERSHVKDALAKLPGTPTFAQVLTKIANAIISFREVSKQEAMLLMLSIPLYFTSISTVFVPCFPPAQRHKSSLPFRLLMQQDPSSTDVWQENVIDHYCNRPLGEVWDDMTLLEFSSWFEVTTAAADARKINQGSLEVGLLPAENEELNLDSESPEEPDQPVSGAPSIPPQANPHWREALSQPPFLKGEGDRSRRLPRFALLGGKGKIARLRKAPRCVTTPMSNLPNLVTKYALLAMNLPFRVELRDLLGVNNQEEVTEERVELAIQRNREGLEARRKHMADGFALRVAEILASTSPSSGTPSSTAALSNDLPDQYHENELLQAMDTEKASAPASVLSHVTDDEDLPQLIAKLSQEQRAILHQIQTYLTRVDEFEEALLSWKQKKEVSEIFGSLASEVPPEPTPPAPPRLIVLGPGGTGKSFLIRVMVLVVRRWASIRMVRRPSPQHGVVLAAPTGVAAFNIGGSTIHSAFDLNVEKTGRSEFKGLAGKHLDTFRRKFLNVQLIIIDEISMVGARILAHINRRLNQAMNTQTRGFFGNIGVVLLGDFLQLRPVQAKPVYSLESPELNVVSGHLHLFRSLFQPVFLTVAQRQKGDEAFARLLLRAREGVLSDEDDILLQSRSLNDMNRDRDRVQHLLETEFAHATWLFPFKHEVDDHNAREVRKLALNSGKPVVQIQAVDEGDISIPLEADIDSTGGLATHLDLTVGATVMIRHNIDVEDGLYNGALGTVAAINGGGPDPMSIFVHFDDPKVGLRGERKEFDGKVAVRIDPKTMAFDLQGKAVKRTQLPVILAFAITIHKCQGLTLQKVVASVPPNLFGAGMAYTAISRVRRLEDIIFCEYDRAGFKVDDGAVAELERLHSLKTIIN